MDGTTPCRGRLAVDPAQSTLKGRFVLRADSIRPYNPSGKLLPSNQLLSPVTLRAADSRPYNKQKY